MKFLLSLTLVISLTVNASEFREALHAQLEMTHDEVSSYKEARTYILGHLFLQSDNQIGYYIETSYCGKEISSPELTPGNLPSNELLQAELVWSQSKFSSNNETRAIQKKDLFNLIPIQKIVNQKRSNLKFGNVNNGEEVDQDCGSYISKTTFEPRDEVKGDIARIMFYFTVRYNMDIDAQQEKVLREWHKNDPVSTFEESLNNRIAEIQGNRNPFIDHPKFVDMIENF